MYVEHKQKGDGLKIRKKCKYEHNTKCFTKVHSSGNSFGARDSAQTLGFLVRSYREPWALILEARSSAESFTVLELHFLIRKPVNGPKSSLPLCPSL